MTSMAAQTLFAALRSVGNAMTMAAGGVYLAKRSLITPGTRKGLAQISQQLTIPALLFSKLLACNQDWSDEPCPSISDALHTGWLMLLWPIAVVGSGLLVGYLACILARTSPANRAALMACVAFGNSTGLPLTLLAVIHSSFSASTELGAVDPTTYLSIYLLFYPVLQWGIGGWLLAPPVEAADSKSHRALSADHLLARYSKPDLTTELASPLNPASPPQPTTVSILPTLLAIFSQAAQPPVLASLLGLLFTVTPVRGLLVDLKNRDDDAYFEWAFDGLDTLGQAAVPINMIILGANLASGLKVPSCLARKTGNLLAEGEGSAATSGEGEASAFASADIFAIVVAKLIILPCVGCASAFLLRPILSIPETVDASFFLVIMIVFCCPTANTMVVMCELSGVNKEAVSGAIFIQYLVAPVILTLSITVCVSIATDF